MAERVYCNRCSRFLVSLTGPDSLGNYLCPACGADARLAPEDDETAERTGSAPPIRLAQAPARSKLKLVPTAQRPPSTPGTQPPPPTGPAGPARPPEAVENRPRRAAAGKERRSRRRCRGSLHRQGPSGSLAVFLILANLGVAIVLYLGRPEAAPIRDRFGLQDPPPPPRAEAETEARGPGAILAALRRTASPRERAAGRPQQAPAEDSPEAPAEKARPSGPSEYKIWLSDGQIVTARLIEEKPTYVRIRHDMGPNGFLVQTLQRSQILNMASLKPDPWSLTSADRRLVRDYPGLHVYRRSPFVIVTDDSFGSVEKTFRILQSQHRQFLTEFEGVLDDTHGTGSIHVVFFRSDDAYRKAAGELSAHLVDASGFYDPDRNRLLLYNQIHSQAYANVEKQIETVRERYETPYGGSTMPASVREHVQNVHRRVASAAQEATYRTIRHEAAHQLFYHFGVHTTDRLDPTWLVEGLATYCETPRIGRRNPERIDALEQAAELIPLRELLAYRGGEAWSAMSRECLLTAYAQSWALVYTLMQEDLRPAFLAYLRSFRDGLVTDQGGGGADPLADLAAALRVEPNYLEKAWESTIASF